MANFSRPVSDGTLGSDWTGPIWSECDESSADDGVTSNTASPVPTVANGSFVVNLDNIIAPFDSSPTEGTYRFRFRVLGGLTGLRLNVLFRQGTSTLLLVNEDADAAQGWHTLSKTVTESVIDSITDFSDLNIKFEVALGPTGDPPTSMEVTWIELELPEMTLDGSGGYATGGTATPELFSLLDDVVNHSFIIEDTNGNSTNMARSDLGIFIMKSPWMDMADVKLDLQDIGSFNGQTSQGETLKPLSFTAECLIQGTDSNTESESARENMIRRMKNFKKQMKRGLLLFKFDRQNVNIASDLDIAYWARVSGPIIMNPMGSSALRFQLNLVVPSGIGVGSTEEQQIETISSLAYGFNLKDSPAIIEGNHPADAVYVYKNLHANDVTSFVLTNTTRGEELTWTGAIPQNESLRIDTARKFVEISSGGSSSFSNGMSGLADTHDFPLLEPDVINVIEVNADQDDSTLTVTWRSAFV